MMNKNRMTKLLCGLVTALLLAACCAACSTKKAEEKPYYTFDVSSVSTVMLKGRSQKLIPVVRNLGVVVDNPNYRTDVSFGGEDVTQSVFEAESKEFTPTDVGEYRVTFTMLDEAGAPVTDDDGTVFAKSVPIEVSKLTFEAKDNPGEDVTVIEEDDKAKISFGDSYSQSQETLDSGQYRVTGVTFNGNFTITYAVNYREFNEKHPDPSLYFGFDRANDIENDDSLKISTGTGSIAAWIFDAENGGMADLSSNLENGWNFKTWYNTDESPTGSKKIENETHYFTVNRYLNADKTQAVYALSFDFKPFVYLNVHGNFTPLLAGLWVESVNTACDISVYDFSDLPADTTAPVVSFLTPDFAAGETADLMRLVSISDGEEEFDFSALYIPSFAVKDSAGEDVPVTEHSIAAGENETYTVTVTVEDLSGNVAVQTTTFRVGEIDRNTPRVSLEETSSVAALNVGMRIYYTVSDDHYPDLAVSAVPEFKLYSDAELTQELVGSCYRYTLPGTQTAYYAVRSELPGKVYLSAAVTNPGDFVGTAVKEIEVRTDETPVYGYKVYETADKDGANVVLTKDSVVFREQTAETVKITPVVLAAEHRNWTLEFSVTQLSFHDTSDSVFGRLNLTIWAKDSSGNGVWQDLGLGGKQNNDLWGFEFGLGESTLRYQWRSTWLDRVTDYMPDPDDPSKGCGRDSSAYAQYGTGKHTYKIACKADDEGNVTYTYYIDNEPEAIHKFSDLQHKNITDFVQIQSLRMSGVVSDFKLY